MGAIQSYPDKLSGRRPFLDVGETIVWSRFLDRPIFSLGSSNWSNPFAGKNILITGAGGSIGSALALQLMSGLASNLILLDRSEANLRALYYKYKQRNIVLPEVRFVQCDILCPEMLDEVFSKYRPSFVFHTAAMKHLNALESDPFGALENNVLGTVRLLQIIDSSPVECFVNLSTDKAVNPTSMLGVSKRLTELLLLVMEARQPKKISLRLGNVLGSSGSVASIFCRLIENRQPLRITHPQATRYFVSVEETAAFLIASAQLPASCLLVPEMEKQRPITELAEFLLNEFGFAPGCYPMEFTGLRDGEKRCEELVYEYEHLQKAAMPGIRSICGNSIDDPERFADDLGLLLELVVRREKRGLIHRLIALAPEYAPSPTLLRQLC
jgi:FlaA1/EpsC-like NDP-sugar epimerase